LNPKELVNFLDDRTVSRLIEIVPKEGLIYLDLADIIVKKGKGLISFHKAIINNLRY
jgi:DNA replication protein DnaC